MKAPNKISKALLVEDNFLNQKFASAILKMNGYSADIAENGQIGVDMYEENEYDVILMDIQMPIMDGLQATKLIRKMEEDRNWERIKIIAVTAFAMPGDQEKFLEAGIDLYLAKPYKGSDLIALMES